MKMKTIHGKFRNGLAGLVAVCALTTPLLHAEICTTQSQMKPADRDLIASTARSLATRIQAGDAASLRPQMIPEFTKDFSGMTSLVSSTSSKIQGAPLAVEQVYLLDATNLKTLADGTNQDAQFYCTLNKSMAETNFLIPSLPPGRYAFALVDAASPKSPWSLSFLLRQDATQNQWLLAGFYPKPLTAGGHDGLWYWTQARDLVKSKQSWTADLYYQQALSLLQPAGFISSTHLEKLRTEATAAAPPSLSAGISATAPLVVKGPANSEYRFTALNPDDSLGANKIDVLVHLAPDPEPEPASSTKPAASAPPALSPRDRNIAAATALLAAYPELRNSFHGVWVFADATGKSPFVTETPMADIH
jgi:hypothetical protein